MFDFLKIRMNSIFPRGELRYVALKIVTQILKMTRLNASTPKKQNSQRTPNQPKIDNFPPKPPNFGVFDIGKLI